MLTLICPKCGKEKKIDDFSGKICSKCFMGESNLIDMKSKDITLCKSCARIRTKSNWQPFYEDELKNMIVDNLKTKLEDYNVKNVQTQFVKDKIRFDVDVEGILNNKKYRAVSTFIIKPQYIMCEDCYKNMSDYFQSIVQIRYEKETLEREEYKQSLGKKTIEQFCVDLMQKIVKDLRKDGDYTANIQKVENTKNGFNMYVGSKSQAIKFITSFKQFFRLERKESSKLMGHEH